MIIDSGLDVNSQKLITSVFEKHGIQEDTTNYGIFKIEPILDRSNSPTDNTLLYLAPIVTNSTLENKILPYRREPISNVLIYLSPFFLRAKEGDTLATVLSDINTSLKGFVVIDMIDFYDVDVVVEKTQMSVTLIAKLVSLFYVGSFKIPSRIK